MWRVAAICGLLTGLYAVVFALTDQRLAVEGMADQRVTHWQVAHDALGAALANAVPAVLLGWLVAMAIVPLTLPLPRRLRYLVHAVIIAGYALATYVTTIVILATIGGNAAPGGDGIIVRYFSGRAFIWQVFQGLAYGSVAILAGLLVDADRRRRAAETAMADVHPGRAAPAPLGRLLLRTDEGIVPVEAADIIRIEGADDYSEVVLTNRRLLARLRMNECEALLANEPMLRAHRSHIINLRQLVSAEPAGNGRLQMLMRNGDIVVSSRGGAQAFRARSG